MRLHQEIRRKKTESLPPVERAISMLETSLEAINNFTQDVGLSYKELIRLRKKKREGTEVMLLEDAGVPVRMSVAHAKYGIRGIDVY
jgi:prefoldin subunit 5